MTRTILILLAVIFVAAPIVLILRNLYDTLINPALQHSKERIKALIPRWIRGK